MTMLSWLVPLVAIVLPWAALAAAWWLSGQWWLGALAMVAASWLAVQIMVSADRYLTDHGR
jgi:hypothetical protein